VEPAEHGLRADVFLTRRMTRLSRAKAAAIVRDGNLSRASGEIVDKPAARVLAGERLRMKRRKLVEAPIDDIALPVIFEDEDLLAVDKPGDLVVHPTASAYARTLIRVLRVRRPGEFFTLAHRLDKETSGLILLAKNAEVDPRLKDDFASRRVKKSYLALVVGRPERDEWLIDAPMRLVPGSDTGVLMEVGGVGAAEAATEVAVLARGRQAALVEARPLTGRQHQIRVHLAHAGHPIIGDKLYLGDEALFLRSLREGLDRATLAGLVGHWRQALHAHRIAFSHPRTEAPMNLSAPLAPDLADLARTFGVSVPPSVRGG